jgi:hypothetical protein
MIECHHVTIAANALSPACPHEVGGERVCPKDSFVHSTPTEEGEAYYGKSLTKRH